ncbi:Uncharacterised protein [Haemophilus parahaemolyticus]|uniref:Uncharacterized protein n=1 Tax=Haemophilus parahaemolyticus TaxID=735 RepID=A0A377HYM3_HAEPH|nr:hypothetical protein [Haemophilus parahaemolyticus]STO63118.1 Uncharacterised protein [Haemophilus parahaemolyticus]
MNNNQGLENIKKQLLDFFSLKKEIGRMEFCIYGVIPISLYIFLLSLSREIAYILSGNSLADAIIGWGLIVVMIASTICFYVFSIQRLNELKLNKNIAYIFILTALLVMIINIIGYKRYSFSLDVSSYFEIPKIILSFICIILIILLSLLKGIDK